MYGVTDKIIVYFPRCDISYIAKLIRCKSHLNIFNILKIVKGNLLSVYRDTSFIFDWNNALWFMFSMQKLLILCEIRPIKHYYCKIQLNSEIFIAVFGLILQVAYLHMNFWWTVSLYLIIENFKIYMIKWGGIKFFYFNIK